MSNLGELKKLYDKGMALIYLREKSKRPIEKKWTSDGRKSWDELENSHEKRYNVGVRLGAPSKLISGKYLAAIDCDVKAKSRAAKVELNDKIRKLGISLDEAPVVISGRGNGSKHIYVQTDKPMQPMKFAQSEKIVKVHMPSETRPHSKREMEELTSEERAGGYRLRPAWEISFMGDGQQTVLPPSVHPDSGMKYEWANPLSVKRLPTFKPEKFVSQVKRKVDERELDFKAEDVNLYESNLPMWAIKLIETGAGSQDRSADLFSVALTMCRKGFTDNQILSVLSHPDNWIASAAYDHTQSNSRARAVKWLHKYTLTKARFETDIARRFENRPETTTVSKEEVEELDEQAKEDALESFPDLDGKGKPKPTIRNIVHFLEGKCGGGVVGHDEFSNRTLFLKDTVYGGVKGQEIQDFNDLNLAHHLSCHYRFEPAQDSCYKAHAIVAQKYRFHPVREYLDSLEWDGVPRLDNWLITAFSAEVPKGVLGLEYLKAVSRKTLVAAVARVYEPGCKFDYMLVLEGLQGKGKSMTLRNLTSDKWFTDSLGDLRNKDVVDQMLGKWVIEFSELAPINKSENLFTKSFISRQVDRVRLAYGRRTGDFPRQSIFIGTTNDNEYLTDETGNRRYWPVKIDEIHHKWVSKNRDQLWAEAKVRYDLAEPLYLTKEIEEVAQREQSKRFQTDEWEATVKKVIETLDERFTTTQVWRLVTNTMDDQPSQQDATRVGKILRRLGYTRQTVRIDGQIMKGWINHAKRNLL